MEYVNLGKSGLKVSKVAIGTMTFGSEADKEMAFKLLDYCYEQGINFVDTADKYAEGVSEKIVGEWLKDRKCRQNIVLVTKVCLPMGVGPNDSGLSRIHIQNAIEASMKRLQVDVIDLYQIHKWDPLVPIEETYETLNDLVRQGKVRYLGCSNLAAWQLSKYIQISNLRGFSNFISIQSPYSLINRGIENEILPLCQFEGLGVITYNPLAGGMLTGKYQNKNSMPKNARLVSSDGYRGRYLTDISLKIVDEYVAFAQEFGTTPARLALAWIIANPNITTPIVGARNLEQLKDTLGGLDLRLKEDDIKKIPCIPKGRWVGTDPVYGL